MKYEPDYEIYYQLYVDDKATPVTLIGRSKAKAYEALSHEWEKYRKELGPQPSRRRCRLEERERVWRG